MNHIDKLKLLRKSMAEKRLDAFLIPMNDEYQNEYVPDSAKRLHWLTGFSGSAGSVIVTANKAAMFTDGRYTLQAEAEVDGSLYERHNIKDISSLEWLKKNLEKGEVGYDSMLYTAVQEKKFASLSQALKFKPVDNLIDAIWKDRPSIPTSRVKIHPLKYAGKSSLEKRQKIAEIIKESGADSLLLTLPDSICWLFNIRGEDVEFTPLVLAIALIGKNGKGEIFIDPERLDGKVTDYFGKDIAINDIKNIESALAKKAKGKKIMADAESSAAWYFSLIEKNGGKIINKPDPCILSKAIKNKTEISGTRKAHIRDGASLVKFFSWLDENAAKKKIDEISASDKLFYFRAQNEFFYSLSFATISGFAGNGAIVHYRSSAKTTKKIEGNGIYLLDSGAQYFDGTTDVTRTISIGNPTQEQKENFTRVLKGHIAIARAKFPQGTTGAELDALARYNLWQAGLDYDHGTGHGVGSFLSVHEGPQRISKRSDVALKSGMIISNEPGYYKNGEYGIRIENLVLVRKSKIALAGEKQFLEFETLTKAPIDLKLIEKNMLGKEEIDWLNDYHRQVFKEVSPYLNKKEILWLKEAVKPL